MKKSFITCLVLAALGFISCKKTDKTTSFTSQGVLKGPSLFMNSCSELNWIIINDTLSCTFNSLPTGSGIDLKTITFPAHVYLNWHYRDPTGFCSVVVIDGIKKAD